MQTYRQRNIEVEAVQFLTEDQVPQILRWVRSRGVAIEHCFDSLSTPYLLISTQEGVLEARQSWWIVKDSEGEFQVMSDRSFRASHVVTEVVSATWYDEVQAMKPTRGSSTLAGQLFLEDDGTIGEVA